MGTIIAGRYEIIEKIGEGGVAIVYKAMDNRLGRTIALKLLREQYAADPAFIARFQNEARAVASLSNPHIVTIYDFGSTGPMGATGTSTYYIAMQYIEGPTLKQYLEQKKRLGPSEAIDITTQILQGLAAAHAKGIVHRDMKPQNVLLTKDGRALVSDFGIAKALTTPSLTEQGMTIGTAEYMAPEQAQGLTVGPTADIYAVGIILYEMLTGVLPFNGTTPVEVAMKQVTQPPRPPREINPAIPPALQDIILKALAKDPAVRFQTADAMINALRSIAVGANQATSAIPPIAAAPTVRAPVTAPPQERTQALPMMRQRPVAQPPIAAGRQQTTIRQIDRGPGGSPWTPVVLPLGILLLLLLCVLMTIYWIVSGQLNLASFGIGGGNPPVAVASATPTKAVAVVVPSATRIPATATPRPAPATNTPVPPTATPVKPTNTPIPPTNTPVPPTATSPAPTATPPAPTETPVIATGINPNHGDIQIKALDFNGGYKNNPPTEPYQGRVATWIYGARTRYNTMETRFILPVEPNKKAEGVLIVDGQDAEDATKAPIQIFLNGQLIYQGPNKLPNAVFGDTGNWGEVSYTFDAGLLRKGENILTFKNLADDDRTGSPNNWMMLDYVHVTWQKGGG